ncbi:TldD/PmbA family protein [Desulfurococcus mucosus]|uniref:Peptidase U62 modulator of DNA gyrase n=1 Tax=Desulfurococcus mucosus (strain ATCC 35584 / DSM 2162 / JCM 9187 / O7/1) TaxID=765177 RepID=E8R7W1_DESM0|nr:TldD/PmbA family protein [Desulfurococcus mucosus]ADV64587.1 peptidase U62 modulator of DNA gyrase [Desulfurococcus mucosus DSM 2162]
MGEAVDLELAVRTGLALGADFIDVRYQEYYHESLSVDNGVLRELTTTRATGIGVRVIVNGLMGYATTNDLSPGSVKRTVEVAVKLARALRSSGMPQDIYERPVQRDRVASHYVENPEDVDLSEKAGLLLDMYKAGRNIPGVSSLTIPFGYERDRRVYASSRGDYVDYTRRMIGIGVRIVASSGGSHEMLWTSESRVAGWEFIESFNWLDYVVENSRLAVEAAGAPHVKPGRYDVVLDNEIVGLMLHEAFGHASEADIVEAGGSVLGGRIGSEVASPLVSIVDDGRIEGGVYVPYDDEGTPKLKTYTVRKGVLSSFLHSLTTARRLGAQPTGNARIMSFRNTILVRQTNTYMEPGDWDPVEMIRDMKRGLYVKGKGAMGGEVNPLTGAFTFTSGPSYIVENGEPVRLVRGVMLSGIILETLRNVDAVGRDLVVRTSVFGGCGKSGQTVRVGDGGPHVRVRGFTIGGG